MPNYQYTIKAGFNPFTLQEMLVPFAAYKEEFDKIEGEYTALVDKADKFKYLAAQTAESPTARAIYKGYADELSKQAQDLAAHGLSMSNRRALTNLKRRYEGEIGQLVAADAAMQKEKELRNAMRGKDNSMLYAVENLNIDDFLSGNTPNLYNISGEDLRKEGMQYAQAASSRIYDNTRVKDLNKYYIELIQTLGYSPELLASWKQGLTDIPEFSNAVKDIMKARGAEDNLTGINHDRAEQNIINGLMEGSIYKENRDVKQNLGVMTEAQAVADRRASQSMQLQAALQGFEYDPKTHTYVDKNEGMYTHDEVTGKRTGYNPAFINSLNKNNEDEWEIGPNGKPRKKDKTPEERAAAEIRKAEVKKRMENASKVKNVTTVEGAQEAGYVPVFATVHPSHGAGRGISAEEARKLEEYGNIEGWRSGPQGKDVKGVYIDWTNAPLIEGSQSPIVDLVQWGSGSRNVPNNGDFSYNLNGTETKMLSDEEVLNLPESVLLSIKGEFKRQGYPEGIPFEVMKVVGRKGKVSYLTFIPQESKILTGN